MLAFDGFQAVDSSADACSALSMSIFEQIVAAKRRARAAVDAGTKRMRPYTDAELDEHSASHQQPQSASEAADNAAAADQTVQQPMPIGVKNFYGVDATRISVVELRLQRFLGHVRRRLETLNHTYATFPLQEQAFGFADAHELSDLLR